MFLYNIKTNSMICDFQLIYESDGRLMFDLYSYGQIKEPIVLGIKAVVTCIDCGLISIPYNDYQTLENKLKFIANNIDLMKYHTKKMIQLINIMIENNKLLEDKLEKRTASPTDLYNTFEALTNVIAYRRLADISSDYIASIMGVEKISKITTPSYLVLFQDALDKLGSQSTNQDISIFICEYAFLNTFSIIENQYENPNYIMKLIRERKNKGLPISKMDLKYVPPTEKASIEKVFYDLSWYSELKHIYQLRILRNFRKYMQLNQLDIIKTDARNLFKNVQTFK